MKITIKVIICILFALGCSCSNYQIDNEEDSNELISRSVNFLDYHSVLSYQYTYLGAIVDQDRFERNGIRNSIIVSNYSNQITINTVPPIKAPKTINRSMSGMINYLSDLAINQNVGKTSILLSSKYDSNESTLTIEFVKPYCSINTKLKDETENAKNELLKKSNKPLYISSMTIGNRQSISFLFEKIDKSKLDNILDEVQAYLDNNGNTKIPLLEQYSGYIFRIVDQKYITFNPIDLLNEYVKLAKTETLFSSESRILAINFKLKNVID